MDVWLPVHMDHMLVNEAYRVWHGRSHMDVPYGNHQLPAATVTA